MRLFLLLMLISIPAFAQEIERIDDKSYVVQTTVTRNLDDQKTHCAKLQAEINRLVAEQKQCAAEVDVVDRQPVPDQNP